MSKVKNDVAPCGRMLCRLQATVWPSCLVLFAVSVCSIVGPIGCAGVTGQSSRPDNPSVAIQPTSTDSYLGQTQQFLATVKNMSNISVVWQVDGTTGGNSKVGTISATGLYTAPGILPAPAMVTVTAVSMANSQVSASATVGLKDNVIISIAPIAASVLTGASQTFTTSLSGTGNPATGAIWAVNGIVGGSPTIGIIALNDASTALYTAPTVAPSPNAVTVTATSQADGSKSASASVTITCGTAASLVPAVVMLAPGHSRRLTATFCLSPSATIAWDVNGISSGNSALGTVLANGPNMAVYTAPTVSPSVNPVTIRATASSVSSGTTTVSAIFTVSINAAYAWVDVLDYGAHGDGIHDDTPAILAAVQAASQGPPSDVYFPPTNAGYLIGTPLVLPNLGHWVTLYLDGMLKIAAPITVPSFYSFYGNGGDEGNPEFTQEATAELEVINPSLDPVIHVTSGSSSIRLENLDINRSGGTGDAILIDGSSCCVALKDVSVTGDGVSLHIEGGFGYVIDGGVYSGRGSFPSVLYEMDPTRCTSTGIFEMRDAVLLGNGVSLNLMCANAASFTFKRVLQEDATGSFLTINEANWVYLWGTSINDIQIAESAGPPYPPLVTNYVGEGSTTSGMQIFNSWGGPGALPSIVAGDPIQDLEVWSPSNTAVGQDSGYVFHSPDGIVSTMPAQSPTAATISQTNPSLTAPRPRIN